MIAPKVTVLMPVYNGEKYLREAIDSILSQIFTDFEFLIINDGSTDQSVAIINSYHDPKIRLVHNEKNLGLIYTLNKGLGLSRGDYIARMDCDDISLRGRLKTQVDFLENHPDVAVLGTSVKTLGANKDIWKYPKRNDEIKFELLFRSVLAHSSVIFRTGLEGLVYDEKYENAEDYELWCRLIERYKFHNLQTPLVKYRIHEGQESEINKENQNKTTDKIRREQLNKLNIKFSNNEFRIHTHISTFCPVNDLNALDSYENWLEKLYRANITRNFVSVESSKVIIGKFWWRLCRNSCSQGLSTWHKYSRSNLSKYYSPRKIHLASFFTYSFLNRKQFRKAHR